MKELLLELFYQKLKIIVLGIVLLPCISNAQIIVIYNQDKNPINGVSVFNETDTFIGISDINGKLKIKDILPVQYLTFSIIGYQKLKIDLKTIVSNNNIVVLERDELKLNEVVIIGRNQQYREDIISETDIITQKEIQVTNSGSTADALAMSGNIFVQKSQFGGGSPVLRGFEANRVLLVLDGVRMNNAIYRNGHLQNTITVDNFSLNRVEVIFGPGSLTYGSDAIGGVIHFKTKNPAFNTKFSQYKFRYSSASSEKTGFIGLNYGLSKFASVLIVSSSSFSNLRAGDNRPEKYPDFGKRLYYTDFIDGKDTIVRNRDYNTQIGTGFSQLNILNKSVFKVNNATRITANIQFSTSSNIPRYDFLIEKKEGKFKYSEWYYGPQIRILSSLRLDLSQANTIYDNAIIIAGLQKINEDRISRKFGKSWRIFNTERLFIFSLSADFKKYLTNKNHEFVYGMDFQNNDLNSSAKRQNIYTGDIKRDILSRYPSGFAQDYRIGGYLQYVFGEKDYPFQISLGSRIETNHISIRYKNESLIKWHDSYIKGVENNNTSYAMSLGEKYKLPHFWKISANISTAFRNPNIDDLGKIRIKKGEIMIPNLNLKTEKSNNIELSLKKEIKTEYFYSNFSVTGFYTILKDAIVRKRFNLPDGSDVYIEGRDTLKVIANQNAEKEKVYGLSLRLKSKIKNFRLSANMVYTKGNIYENGVVINPAAHIPPLFGNIRLGYLSGKLAVRYIFLFNAKKPLELYGGSVDNPENATIEGTYSWSTHNVYFEYKFNMKYRINFAIENIFDSHYRSFSSGVSAPGRNVIISISGKLY